MRLGVASLESRGEDGLAVTVSPYPPRVSQWWWISLLFAALLFSSPAHALTLEDILALTRLGYDEVAIVKLIEDTGSVFHLTAPDLIELKNAGVSEKVLQAMIRTRAPAFPDQKIDSLLPSSARHEHEPAPGAREVFHGSREPPDALPAAAFRTPRRPLEWSAYAFDEDDHAGGHEHAAVALGELDILVLRDEAAFPDVLQRASAVSERLRAAFDDPSMTFEARPGAKGFWVYAVSSANHREEELLEVNPRDAVSFARRSARAVEPGVLARWWAALLRDYHRVLACGEPPRDTAELHVGKALVVLYERARDAAPEGALPPAAVNHALASLTKTQWEHLKEMAGSVPRDFEEHAH